MTRAGVLTRRMLWFARRALARLDMPVLAALVIACLLVLFHVFVLLPQQSAVEAADRSRGNPRNAPALAMTRVASSADAEAAALTQFYGFFGNSERQADVIARLVVMATDLGLAYRRIDYRPLPESSLGLDGFQIQLPISGAYPELRNFVSTVLTRMPTITLDQIEIARRKDGKDGVEAQMSFSYHYREAR